MASGKRIFSAIWATETGLNLTRATRDCLSMRPAWFYKRWVLRIDRAELRRSDSSLRNCSKTVIVGEVAEWLMAPVLKTGIPERVSGVRIPSSPPSLTGTALLSVWSHDRVFRIARHAELGKVG